MISCPYISRKPNNKVPVKITDIVNTKEFTYSLEVTPDITTDVIDKLTVEPVFYFVTWHAKQNPLVHGAEHLEIPPLRLARYLNNNGKNVCLHISCDLLRKEYLDRVLQHLQDNGICNLLIILGEAFDGSQSVFKSSKQLVEYIRKSTKTYFCIGVAGYPDDPDTLKELKQKVDRGASFVLTRAFFKHHSFRLFEKQCEKLGITVPIIPGTGLTEKLVLKIKESKSGVKHVHLFTMNKLDNVEKFIKDVVLVKKEPPGSRSLRASNDSSSEEDCDWNQNNNVFLQPK